MRGMVQKQKVLQRNVQDPSFFLELLRTKMNEISSEIEKLNKESEQLKHDATKVEKLTTINKNIAAEIDQQQLELRVLNMALKFLQENPDTALEVITTQKKVLQESNEKLKDENNSIFKQRKK